MQEHWFYSYEMTKQINELKEKIRELNEENKKLRKELEERK